MSAEVLTRPVFLNKTVSKLSFKSKKHHNEIYAHSTNYRIGAVGYWVFVCLVGGIANWAIILYPNFRNIFNGPVAKFWTSEFLCRLL